MGIVLMLRRRLKKILGLALGCYVVFLVLNVTTWRTGNSNNDDNDVFYNGVPGLVRPVERHGRAALSDHHLDDEVGGGGGEEGAGGLEGKDDDVDWENRNLALLPETLDKVIQQQPGGPAARRKLSKPEPQNINVVVEDALPGTFQRLALRPESPTDFKDLGNANDVRLPAKDGRLKDASAETVVRMRGGLQNRPGVNLLDVHRPGLNKAPVRTEDGSVVREEPSIRRVENSGGVRVPGMEMGRRVDRWDNDRQSWLAPDGAADDLIYAETYRDDPESIRRRQDRERAESIAAARQRFINPPKASREANERFQNIREASRPVASRSQTPSASALNISVSSKTAKFKEVSDVTLFSAFYDDRLMVGLVRILGVGPRVRRPSPFRLWCLFPAEGTEPVPVSVHQTADCKRMQKSCFFMMHCQVPEGVAFSPSEVSSVVVMVGKREDNFLTQSGERLHVDVIVNDKRPLQARAAAVAAKTQQPEARLRRFARDTREAQSSDHRQPPKDAHDPGPSDPLPQDSSPGARLPQQPLFSVCVPPLHGKTGALQLVEFIELNRLLGAVHFTFYRMRVSREVARVLSFYQEAGVATTLTWNLPAPNNVWYKGQGLAEADCLFRNMHLFDVVVLHSLDEFVIPRKTLSWADMLKSVQTQNPESFSRAAVLELLPVMFYPPKDSSQSPSGKVGASFSRTEASRFTTLRCTAREAVSNSSLSKLMVRPERVLEVDGHRLISPISEVFTALNVDLHAASVHHYHQAPCSSQDESCHDLSEDLTVWRYKALLIERTKSCLQKMNRFGSALT